MGFVALCFRWIQRLMGLTVATRVIDKVTIHMSKGFRV